MHRESNNRDDDNGGSAEEDALQLPSLIAVAAVAWRRKSLVLLGAVIGLVIGSLYYAQITPLYESTAQVLVVKKRPEAVTGYAAQFSQFEDYMNTHQSLLRSPLVVERAVNEGNLSALETFAGEERDLTEAVIENLRVGTVSKNGDVGAESILGLTFRGKVPEECALVIQAVLDSYKQFLGEAYRDMSEDTVKLISAARDMLKNDLADQEKSHREFLQTSPLIWVGKDKVNPRQERLAMIESQRSTLLLRETELEGQLAMIERARSSGRSAEEVIALASDLANKAEHGTTPKNERLTLQSQLLPLLVEEQSLLEDLGPNHPHVQSVRKQIEATKKFFALPPATYEKLHDAPVIDGANAVSKKELLEHYLQYLNDELAHLKATDQSLREIYDAEHEAARKMASYEIRDQEFRRGIERTQALYDGIIKQLQDVGMVKDYGGFEARVIAPAGVGKKVVPNAMSVFPVAGLLGVFLGFGLVYLAELMDRKFRTPEEISRQLGSPVLGHIPWFEGCRTNTARAGATGRTLAPMLCTYHEPRSAVSEAYRGLRTALYFSAAGMDHRVIQITSPSSSDGKTTLAANVAVSMAQSGKKVLLIDAELRNPQLHHLFGTTDEVGLASVISETLEYQDAIQETGIPNLWLLPRGSVLPDAAELLTSPRFSELIAAVREQYDYVLVDSAPLLAVTDPCITATRVDGVLLTIRVSQNDRQQALRAKAILSSLGVNLLGVVVNATDETDGGYRYGYRQNGYGYSDRYYDETRGKQHLHASSSVMRS
jgi:capsular exopolysaccharide synthesis family protein